MWQSQGCIRTWPFTHTRLLIRALTKNLNNIFALSKCLSKPWQWYKMQYIWALRLMQLLMLLHYTHAFPHVTRQNISCNLLFTTWTFNHQTSRRSQICGVEINVLMTISQSQLTIGERAGVNPANATCPSQGRDTETNKQSHSHTHLHAIRVTI